MLFATNESLPYLKPGRLEDVIFLIQYLGREDEAYFEADDKEEKVLDYHTPKSLGNWLRVADDHPEFFRIAGSTEKKSVYLWHRYYEKGEKNKRPPLNFSQVQALVDNVLKIHERQVKQDERVKWALPLWGAFVGVILNCVIQVWLHFSK
jgi:hypothetical protein